MQLTYIGLVVAGLVFCAAVPGVRAADTPPDPSLMLHYTFDEAHGDVAKDLSSHGHDGKIVKAQYLEEFNGRRGVLRFDGKQSILHCPNSDSLDFAFDTDMSFEMQVRFNSLAGDSRGMIFGDLNNFGLHVNYWNTLILNYSRFNTELSTHESMGIPVKRHVMSDQWSHIAVVVEYPRIRFYKNGELFHDAYMPVSGARKRFRIPKRIGGWDDRCAPIDLDEFRLYRRALSAAEIAAHAKGKEVPPGQVHELAVEPYWYENTLALRLSCKGLNYKNHTAEVALLDGNDEPVVAAQKTILAESSVGSGRYMATVRFPLNGLEGRSLDGVTRIFDPNGELVKTVYRHAYLKKPEWVHTQEGYSDKVLPPWTPVDTLEKPDGTVEVRIWGRRYVFGVTPFAQQIETRGENILTSPITLSGRADGKPMVWKDGRTSLRDASETAVSLEQTSTNDHATVRVNASVEYDGYMIFDCEVKARRDLSVENLVLEIPLRARHATLCHGDSVYPENPKIPMKRFHTGTVSADLSFRFSPNIWIGDEERGLSWQAESDENWHYADKMKAIEILPRSSTTIFRANLVDVPTPLAAGEALHYKFALLATPTKPLLRDSWDLRIARCEPYGRSLSAPDEKVRGKPAIQFYREMGIRHLFTTECDMWPYPMPIHERYSRFLHRLNNQLHAAGITNDSYMIHERFPTMAPEFNLHGLHMSKRPLHPYYPGPDAPPGKRRPGPVGMDYGADSQITMAYCAKSKAVQDAYVHALARRLDVYGDGGVYLDGTMDLWNDPCKNTLHGCGYRAEDGSIQWTHSPFAVREFMKRIYTVVKQRRPDGIIDHHSWVINPAGLAYSDMFWTGERWTHLRDTGAKDGYISAELPLDMFRAAFSGRQLGVAAETLSYRLGGGQGTADMKVAAISLLHDIPVRPNTPGFDRLYPEAQSSPHKSYFDLISQLWKVRDQFGAKEAKKLFYWNNQKYVRVSPEKCYATLFQHPKNGVLAFISNLCQDARTVNVHLQLEKLGLLGTKIDVFNVLTEEAVDMTADGKISMPLGSEAWVYVWVRPNEG